MPKVSEMYPSEWFSSKDFVQHEDENTGELRYLPMTLTITEVKKQTEIGQKKETKWVVLFQEIDKKLILKPCHTGPLESCFGDDTDDWISKRVVFMVVPITYQGETFDAVRVNERGTKTLLKPKAAKVAAVTTSAEVDADDCPF